MSEVVVVDYRDRTLGVMDKLSAHEKAVLHRAFSVFLYQGDRILIQKRAECKYHCGGLWTNTCCSHPALGEDIVAAGIRRLSEELGIETDSLAEADEFVYYCAFANGLTEFEYDHILIGQYEGECTPDPEEVSEVRWVDIEELLKDARDYPGRYTPWFLTALQKADAYIRREN